MNWSYIKPRIAHRLWLYSFKSANLIWRAGAGFFDWLPNSLSRHIKEGRVFPAAEEGVPPWRFHSESCVRVLKRWEHRKALQDGDSISVVDEGESVPEYITCGNSSLDVESVPDGGDKWAYLYLSPAQFIWKNFTWSFTVRRENQFRELQFGFRYRDFYNRYRFRHENQIMRFDVVRNGRFSNDLLTAPCHMEAGQDYRFEITAVGRAIRLCVDDQEIMRVIDPGDSFPEGSIAFIFWENNGKTPISVKVSDIAAWNLRAS